MKHTPIAEILRRIFARPHRERAGRQSAQDQRTDSGASNRAAQYPDAPAQEGSMNPTAALHEVLLRAALRAERINRDRLLDGENAQKAKHYDNSAILYRHRVPATSQENAHDSASTQSMDNRI